MYGPFQLTFGVEIEFVCQYRVQIYEHAASQVYGDAWKEGKGPQQVEIVLKRMVRTHMIGALRAQRLSVNDIGESDYHRWTVATDASIRHGQEDWEEPEEQSGYIGIEIKSPASFYSQEALKQVGRVVEFLKHNFDIFINPSCGLHVHVGNSYHGFEFQSIKNLLFLVTIFEKQFNQLHPQHRSINPFCQLTTKRFPGLNILEVLQRIENLSSIMDLLKLFNFASGQAYNFLNLHKGGMGTIEFRQHEGTIDSNAILAWVELTCSLVSASHHLGALGFLKLIVKRADDPHYSIIDILRHLTLNHLAEHYSNRVHDHSEHDHLAWEWFDRQTRAYTMLPDWSLEEMDDDSIYTAPNPNSSSLSSPSSLSSVPEDSTFCTPENPAASFPAEEIQDFPAPYKYKANLEQGQASHSALEIGDEEVQAVSKGFWSDF